MRPHFTALPVLPQRQDSLQDQLDDLWRLANQFGLYDAADWMKDQLGPPLPRERIPQDETAEASG